MRAHSGVLALLLMLLACRGAVPPSDAELPTPPAGMPTLERQVLALADSDLAEDQYWPLGVTESGSVVYRASEDHQPMFRVVDSTGKRLQAFGRQGEGPGEFREPLELIIRGDSLRIFDASRMTLLQYTLAGKSVKDSRALMLDIPLAWPGDSIDHWVPPAFTRTERIVIRRSRMGDSAGRVVIPEHDSGFQAILASAPAGKRLALLPYAVGPNRIYLGAAWPYRIYRYDAAGQLRSIFGRRLPPHFRGPRELAETRAELVQASGPSVGPKGEKVAGPNFAARLDTLAREVTPYFSRSPLHIDQFGRLWVVGLTNDSTTVDVFADTTFLGRVTLPCYLARRGVPVALNGRWLALECSLPATDDRASELQLYRIVERGDAVKKP